jgi:hypothetical protein
MFALGGGWIVLNPLTPDDEGLVLKRGGARRIDPERQQITIEHAHRHQELGSRSDEAPSRCPAVRLWRGPSGRRWSCGNRMPAAALRRLWPTFVALKVRDWVVQHIVSGIVERVDIATNATVAAMQVSGPPILKRACRSKSSAIPPRCVRWRDYRRFATPT